MSRSQREWKRVKKRKRQLALEKMNNINTYRPQYIQGLTYIAQYSNNSEVTFSAKQNGLYEMVTRVLEYSSPELWLFYNHDKRQLNGTFENFTFVDGKIVYRTGYKGFDHQHSTDNLRCKDVNYRMHMLHVFKETPILTVKGFHYATDMDVVFLFYPPQRHGINRTTVAHVWDFGNQHYQSYIGDLHVTNMLYIQSYMTGFVCYNNTLVLYLNGYICPDKIVDFILLLVIILVLLIVFSCWIFLL